MAEWGSDEDTFIWAWEKVVSNVIVLQLLQEGLTQVFNDIARKNARDCLESTLVIVRIVIALSRRQFVFDYEGSRGLLTSTRHGCTVLKEMLDRRSQ